MLLDAGSVMKWWSVERRAFAWAVGAGYVDLRIVWGPLKSDIWPLFHSRVGAFELCSFGLEVEPKAMVRGAGQDAQRAVRTIFGLDVHCPAYVLAMGEKQRVSSSSMERG